MREHATLDYVVGAVDVNGDGPFLPCDSPTDRFQVVFEDDGTTAYFYALDPSIGEQPIVDAVHIYDVSQVADRDRPCRASIAWSTDGRAAALSINGATHAVFDFSRKRGWCRTGFPSPSTEGPWAQARHEWDEDADAILGG